MGKTQNLSIQNCLLGVKCWNLKTMKINRFSLHIPYTSLLKEGVPLHAYIKVPLLFSPFLHVLGVVVFQYHVFCQVTVISLKIWKKKQTCICIHLYALTWEGIIETDQE